MKEKFETTDGDVDAEMDEMGERADRFIVFGHIDSRSW